ncbi:MAG: FAD-binding protein [Myxococcaceae bacterium]|nr:FAD-binding protein [Myxococcaceae bacterium]
MTRVEPSRVRALLDAFREAFGAEADVATDPVAIEPYGRDESDLGTFPPDAVIRATSTAQVAKVLALGSMLGVPVTPVGARSGKSGGSLPVRGGVSLSLERMNRVLEVNPADLLIVVQPGVLTQHVDDVAARHGLFYPPDPNSAGYCTMGGNVAENAGGPRALKYGVTRDYVLGLEWVLPTGEVVRVGRRTSKGVAGYDLVGLFVGSEGTLGVATEITLKLIPRPRVVRTALIPFRNVSQAAEAITEVLTSGLWPRTLELLDDVALQAIAGRGLPVPGDAGAVIIAEVDGVQDDAVLADLASLVERCASRGSLEAQVAQDEVQRERLWSVRREVSPALRALGGRKISEDVVVPRSKVPEAIERFKAAGARAGLVVATYGHAGDGNLHTNVLYRDRADWPRVEAVLADLMAVTVELGGTITGEHGVGLAKQRFLGLEQAPALLDLQRRLRVFFDPAVTMNPGKVFPDPGKA